MRMSSYCIVRFVSQSIATVRHCDGVLYLLSERSSKLSQDVAHRETVVVTPHGPGYGYPLRRSKRGCASPDFKAAPPGLKMPQLSCGIVPNVLMTGPPSAGKTLTASAGFTATLRL